VHQLVKKNCDNYQDARYVRGKKKIADLIFMQFHILICLNPVVLLESWLKSDKRHFNTQAYRQPIYKHLALIPQRPKQSPDRKKNSYKRFSEGLGSRLLRNIGFCIPNYRALRCQHTLLIFTVCRIVFPSVCSKESHSNVWHTAVVMWRQQNDNQPDCVRGLHLAIHCSGWDKPNWVRAYQHVGSKWKWYILGPVLT
jgi:hypothetical protein